MASLTNSTVRSPVRAAPLLGAVVVLAVALAAAWWQWERAKAKEALQARIERAERMSALRIGAARVAPEAIDHRRIVAQGRWDTAHTILLDNQVRANTPGYRVLTPLRLADGGRTVLVERGWVPAPRTRRQWPVFDTPADPVVVVGFARVPRRGFTLSSQIAEGHIWQTVDLERYRAWSGLDLHPFVLQQIGVDSEGLARDAHEPRLQPGKHYGFAAMWLALGVAGSTILALSARARDGT